MFHRKILELRAVNILCSSHLIMPHSPKTRSSSIDWAQLSRFHLKTETESCLRNIVLNKNRTMDNVQRHNSCINIPSSQTFRS
jgi:hypothetical protein